MPDQKSSTKKRMAPLTAVVLEFARKYGNPEMQIVVEKGRLVWYSVSGRRNGSMRIREYADSLWSMYESRKQSGYKMSEEETKLLRRIKYLLFMKFKEEGEYISGDWPTDLEESPLPCEG